MQEPAGMVTFVAKEGRLPDLIELLAKMAVVAGRDDGCEIYAVHRFAPRAQHRLSLRALP